jgi:nucleotide-binding universal stress UspA family protein
MLKVLFPIDDSPYSWATLEWASGFLPAGRVRIHLLHVIYEQPEMPVTDQEVSAAIRLLDNARNWLESNNLDVERSVYVMTYGSTANAICHYADELAIDEIVMGSHGRGAIGSLLMGSVSQGVFQQARQPVLLLNNRPQSIREILQREADQQNQLDNQNNLQYHSLGR